MFKKITSGLAAVAILIAPVAASAHVIVTPSTANVAQELVFSVSVPNEEQVPVTNLKLDIPEGVTEVTPTTKDGWTIQTIMSTGADPEVTSITWTGGQIPVGQRQDFSFGAQVPAKASQLDWKAYQTYANGTIVHWDQPPAGSDDSTGDAGPYSVTKVTDDLAAKMTAATKSSNTTVPLILSLVAIVLSTAGFMFRKK